ncbi:anaerobic ribonucleoside-triphosphate reductase [Bifidobacterium sp. CP2]|uniref:anaerobic ribonucleoside-triphosphate reductase n=1 Tax=Bifidobacterium TaxID=1678 RepID=UPI001BDBE917|nr:MULTISPECIES: anaerobic ribonucleoside-triphosphate reductase [Bifidobacterium]MBT1182164.1 anaerobic ribonucleoside-triphosphate reductase [Bifidobacterium sp. CP2]MBW3081442.1 anaerobic ribonucleoside-triphosphate reductase [Bifidobacterium saguinibicoloris]
METEVLETATATRTSSQVQVEKRDGRIVDFDPINIISAVKAAFGDLDKQVGPEEEKLIRSFADQVEGEIKERYAGPAKIEDIQNLVEHALIDAHLYDVARAYTTYRLDKDIERAKATDVNEAVSRFINQDPTLIHENANKDANVYATQRDLLAGAVSKAAAFNMLPPAVSNAHMKGDIHFHDADYSPFTAQSNCSLPNFWDMLANGFTLGNAPMASPKSIAIAATQITQIMKDVASSQYGGQTANRADEHLARYAKLDYEKFLEEAREMIPDDMPIEFARRQVANAKANEPSKLHFEKGREPLPMDTPFHEDVDELEQEREILAKIRTRKAIYDAMQTMEYQINSNRVSNGQTPFVTVGFGLGTDWFSREIQRAILLNRIRGLGKEHHTAIFPKLVFTVRHGVNADPGDPNYDLKQLALESATKRMYPDVVFYENIVKITGSFKAPMGCRSFLQGWINPATGKDEEDGRMNLGVVSVNVPRIALESHGDKERFWKLFNERMEVAHQALQFRIMRCKQATPVNAPTLFRFGAFGRLGANDNVDTLFKNERATVSLGYIGLAETTAVFYGKNWIRDHGWDPEGKEFALSIVKRMSELCKQWSKAEGYHYSVYSTPAESLTDRFNRMDREKFGRVEGVTDHDFYTNSFHYPVWLQPTPMEKLNYEKDFPYYASGGFINYCEYPCLQDNPKALEAVWDYAYNVGIGYLGTNTPIDHCFVCGFQGDFEPTDEGFKCPECGNSDPDKCNVTKRTCGYLGNPVQRPMVHGRHEEISHRVKHMSGETGHVTLDDGSTREWFEEAK